MRLSIDPSDPGYKPEYFGSKIFLNDVEVKLATLADEERGMVVILRKAKDGDVLFNPSSGHLAEETLYGVVRIELVTLT